MFNTVYVDMDYTFVGSQLSDIKDKFSKGQKYTYIWLNLSRSRFENLSAYYIDYDAFS